MSRETWVWRNGALIEKHLAPPRHVPFSMAHYVIPDAMSDTVHPVTGRAMDSKSAFRRVTRQAGCVEVGNERQPMPRPVEMDRPGHDLKRALEMHRGR